MRIELLLLFFTVTGCGNELAWEIIPASRGAGSIRWTLSEGECGTGGSVVLRGSSQGEPVDAEVLEAGRYCLAAFDVDIERATPDAPTRCRLRAVDMRTVSLPRDHGSIVLTLAELDPAERALYDAQVVALEPWCRPQCDPDRCACGASDSCLTEASCPSPIRSSQVVASDTHVCALVDEPRAGVLTRSVVCWGDRRAWTDAREAPEPDITARPEHAPFELRDAEGNAVMVEQLVAAAGLTCALGLDDANPVAQCLGRFLEADVPPPRTLAVDSNDADPPTICRANVVGTMPDQVTVLACNDGLRAQLDQRSHDLAVGPHRVCAVHGDQLECWSFDGASHLVVDGSFAAIESFDDVFCAVGTDGSLVCGDPEVGLTTAFGLTSTQPPFSEVRLAERFYAVRTRTGGWRFGERGTVFQTAEEIFYPAGSSEAVGSPGLGETAPEDVALFRNGLVLGGERVVVTDLGGRRYEPDETGMDGRGNTSTAVDGVCPP